MKKYLTLVLLSISTICFSQIKEMMEALKLNQPDKAIKIGQDLKNDSDSFEINFLFAKAYNQKKDFKNAELLLRKQKFLVMKTGKKPGFQLSQSKRIMDLAKL